MQLTVSQEDLENDIESERRTDSLNARIKEYETDISETEKKIAVLEGKYRALHSNFIITVALLIAVAGIFVYIASNAAVIAVRFVSQIQFMIVLLVAAVAFIAYAVRRAAKDIPMYVHCRQEERGSSQDTTNYVYRIKQEQRRLAEYREGLADTKRQLDELVEGK